jgi:hypothetical protein
VYPQKIFFTCLSARRKQLKNKLIKKNGEKPEFEINPETETKTAFKNCKKGVFH